jgi:hypothetical protein
MLSGDQDGGAPTDGILVLEEKLAAVYGLYGQADRFRSVIYRGTGHEYLPKMKPRCSPGSSGICRSRSDLAPGTGAC